MFATQAEAETAAEAIYSNMVESIDSPDLLNVDTGEVVPKDDLSPDEAVQVSAGDRHYPVFGINAASLRKDDKQGYTTAWAVARETLQGQWVFPKPQDSWMTGLTGYTIEPYDPGWFPDAGT